ncbi:hypothetical protein JW711_03895 [Candidatus Woesearchaeota archaeon]|nr:hypothetical protein [Candidatus Woesearchaeota archaeon]
MSRIKVGLIPKRNARMLLRIALLVSVLGTLLMMAIQAEGVTNCGTTTNYTNCTAYGCIIIKDNDGTNRAIFDGGGFIDVKGSLTQSSVGTPDGNDFIIKDSGGTTVAWIDDSTGNMSLASTATDDTQTTCTPPANSFVVRNKTGSCVAYISSAGAVWSRGRLCYNADI